MEKQISKSKNSASYKRLLETDYGFTGGNASNTRDLTYKDGKLTGLLKEFKGDLTGAGFSSEDKSGYYFSFFAEFEDEELVNSASEYIERNYESRIRGWSSNT